MCPQPQQIRYWLVLNDELKSILFSITAQVKFNTHFAMLYYNSSFTHISSLTLFSLTFLQYSYGYPWKTCHSS